ncbi:MAG: glycosyltransferase family 39 protein, partial [Anaerolineae bacterium]|nr:glycosyltransferase family 39 protein [Anaerolineae bacterium]
MRKLWSRGRQILSKQLTPNLSRRMVWGLLLVAFTLRTYALGRAELTFDEVASFFIANRRPLDVLTYVRGAIREHPPLYYVILSLWMPLTGTSEFAIRFLSIIIGVAAVAVIYRALQRITHRWLALLSALLLTLSPSHIGISRDARMYGLLALWTIVSAWAFVRLLEHERTSPTSTTQPEVWPKWGLFWLVTGLGTFTHYFMLFVLLAEDLYLVLRWRRYRRLLIPWLAIHAALGGIGAFWVVNSPGLRATLLSIWERGLASTVQWQALVRGLNGLYLGATARPISLP